MHPAPSIIALATQNPGGEMHQFNPLNGAPAGQSSLSDENWNIRLGRVRARGN
jgi:hypothetical protein